MSNTTYRKFAIHRRYADGSWGWFDTIETTDPTADVEHVADEFRATIVETDWSIVEVDADDVAIGDAVVITIGEGASPQ